MKITVLVAIVAFALVASACAVPLTPAAPTPTTVPSVTVVATLVVVAALPTASQVADTATPAPVATVTLDQAPTPGATKVATTSATTSPRATEPAQVNDAEPVIIFERSGGIAGRHDLFRIYADGRVESTAAGKTAVTQNVPPELVAAVVTHMVDAGFFSLADEYLPKSNCCDLFTYKLSVVHDGVAKTVTTMDSVQLPPALALAIKEVSALTR